MSRFFRFLLLCSCAVAVCQAQTNGSFEQDFNAWTKSGNLEVRTSNAASTATNGTKFVAFNGGQTTPNGILSQAVATSAGTTYTLAFDAGAYGAATVQRVQVSATGSSSLLSQIISVTGPGGNSTRWLPQSFTFTANSASTVIRFADISTSSTNVDLLLDNVRLVSSAPRTLTITSAPTTGLNITVTPPDLNGAANGTTQFTRRYPSGSMASLTAPAAVGGLSFVKWQRNGTDFSTNRTTSVTVDGDHTMSALYGTVTESIVNGSFESGFTGWIKSGSADIQAALPFVASDGIKLAGFNGSNATPNGAVAQSFTTTPGTSYTVAFDLGLLAFNGNEQKLQVTVDGTGNLLDQTVSITGPGNGSVTWVPKTFTFVANSTTAFLSFTDISTSTVGLDVLLDKVSVTTISTTPLTPPTVTADSVTIHPGQKVNVPVLTNDTGNIDPATLQIVTQPAFGTAVISTVGKILYTRSGGGTAADSFTYRVSGSGGLSSSASVSISIAGTLRIPSTTLNVPSNPPATAVEAVPAFPGMSFKDPIAFVSPPGDTKRLFVGELGGKIKVISDVTAASPASTVVLDLVQTVTNPPRVPAESWNPGIDREDGLLGFAFHPNFASNGYIFVSYAIVKATDPTVWYQRLSRFTVPSQNIANPVPIVDPASEYIFIEQRDRDDNHNGGDIHFGPDGYLYTAIGDEAANYDYRKNSQRIDLNFFGAMLRIDVDKKPGNLEPNAHPNPAGAALGYSSVNAIKRDEIPAGSGNFVARYSIPIDNPYVRVNQGGSWNGTFNGTAISAANLPYVRSEFYAVGLRNPWRFTIDDTTGEILVGDVGQDAYEEVNLIVKGGNYGWAFREGAHAGVRTAPAGFTSIDPLYEYTHTGTAGDSKLKGNSVIGGVVYRGDRFTSLSGAYIFGDNVSGHIWAMTRPGGTPVVQRIAGQASLSTFGTDPSNGDVLLADYSGGRIMRIVTTTDPGTFPTTLGATGLFADLADLSPSPGLLPYAPILSFWSDYAVKRRWFTIPDGTSQMEWSRDGAWTYPSGQIWVKHFDLESERGNPASPKKRIETRVLVKNSTGVYGVSYRWNEAGTEATLAADGGEDFPVQLTVNGAPYTQQWSIPSRSQCITCHSPEAGHALSFNTRQLNQNNTILGYSGNQIELLRNAGYLSNTPDATPLLPRHVLPGDTSVSQEERVRSYLAVNCSYCHAGDVGSASAGWDGRPETLLADTGLIDGHSSVGDDDFKLIAPGDPDHSVVLQRMAASNGFSRMPPIGSNELDAVNIALVTNWINQIGGTTNTKPTAVADSYTTGLDTPLAISSPGVLGNDTDAQSDPLQALLVSTTTNGSLSLASNGGFTYTPEPGFSGLDSFTYRANDGLLNSTTVTVSLRIISPRLLANSSFEMGESGWRMTGNRAVVDSNASRPAIDGTKLLVLAPGNTAPDAVISQTFSTIPGQPYTLDFSMGINAPNNSELKLKVTISGFALFREQTESLFGNSLGNTVGSPKSLGFTADSTRTTVTFTDVSTGPSPADLLLDNIRISGPAGEPNSIPVAVAESYSLIQDTPLVISAAGVLANDTDADADSLTALLDAGPSHGTLTLAGNGGFTYTPASGYSGPDSFTYHANDTISDSNVVTVNLSVSVLNTAPVAVADSYSTNQNTALVVPAATGVLSNDTDAQANPLTAILSVGPTHGALSLNANGGFTYTPASGYAGNDSFTYRANDGSLNSSIATVNLVITVVNTAPVAVADAYSVSLNTALVVAATGVLSNDSDAQANPLTSVLDVGPTNGTLTLSSNGGFTYTPTTGYTGPDSFTYHARDGSLDSNIVTVSISVTQVIVGSLVNGSFESGFTGWTATGNQVIQSAAPYAATDGTKLVGFNGGNSTPNGVLSQTFATSPGQTYTLTFDAGVLFYTSATQVINVTVNGSANLLNRTISISGSGSGPNRWLPQSFTFTTDSNSTMLTFRDQSTTTNIIDLILDNVRIAAVLPPGNTAPVAVADSYTTNQGVTLVVPATGVLANDTDAQSNPLTAVLNAGPAQGTLSLAPNGGFTYTPTAGYTGPDSFTYRANDGSLNSNIVTVSITVNGLTNTAPVAVADSYSTNQGVTLVVPAAGVLANDTDAQSNPLTAVLNAGPVNGILSLAPNGGFTYTPATGYTGPDLFTYRANDGSLDSNIVTVDLTVNQVSTVGLVNGSFESGFTGWTTIGNQSIQSAAPFVATDGTKLVGFNGGNTTPNAVLSQTFATTPGQSYTLAFDAGVLFYTSSSQVMNVTLNGSANLLARTLTLTGSGSGPIRWLPQNFTFTADSGSTTLTFRDQSTSTSAIDLILDNVRITAVQAPVNTAPVAVADSYSTNQGVALVVPAAGVLANDTDAQSNPLTAALNAVPANGSLILNANGGFSYTPAVGYTGPDSFTYRANDGSLDSNVVTVSITVNAVVAGTLVNGSFESGFTGWNTIGNQVIQSAAPYIATAGTKLVGFNGGNSTPNGVLSQTFATTPGQSYTLAFDAGILFYTSAPQVMNVTVNGNANLLTRTLTLIGSGSGPIRWLPQSFIFIADSGSTTLTFRDQSSSTNAIDLLLDNVRVQGSVAPATLVSEILTGLPASSETLVGSSLTAVAPGEFSIRMDATVPGSYVLERSEDLASWQVIEEKLVTEAGPLNFQDQPNALTPDQPKPKVFYRIGLKPPGSTSTER